MFEEKTEYDITVKPTGHIEVRRSDIVLRDNQEIARTYHRHVVTPGDDVSEEVEQVQNIAEAVWTTALIEAASQLQTQEL
ncbi:hypothetical protein [Phyllobacterium sp. SB3]|uniref:hypothetical protein n=1 Tax=Phyllobacterium sp. SB3 TaxID=3156073 RepID=UPI0032AF1AF4